MWRGLFKGGQGVTHVWTRPDVKDVLKAKRSNAVMYPASANMPCPDGIRAPGPHHQIGI